VIAARHGVRAELYMAERGGFGAGAQERKPSRALEMCVQTDARIDLHHARNAEGWAPRLNQEQRLSGQGRSSVRRGRTPATLRCGIDPLGAAQLRMIETTAICSFYHASCG
jgi:hypothetical protein